MHTPHSEENKRERAIEAYRWAARNSRKLLMLAQLFLPIGVVARCLVMEGV